MIRGTEYRLVARNSGRSESGQARYARNQHSTRQDPIYKYTSCYELNGDDSRALATIGAFRVVSERDLRDVREESLDAREPDLRHLRSEGLMRFVALDGP